MSDSVGGTKDMYVGERYAGKIFYDALGYCQNQVVIDQQGHGLFKCQGGSVSVYICQEEDNG